MVSPSVRVSVHAAFHSLRPSMPHKPFSSTSLKSWNYFRFRKRVSQLAQLTSFASLQPYSSTPVTHIYTVYNVHSHSGVDLRLYYTTFHLRRNLEPERGPGEKQRFIKSHDLHGICTKLHFAWDGISNLKPERGTGEKQRFIKSVKIFTASQICTKVHSPDRNLKPKRGTSEKQRLIKSFVISTASFQNEEIVSFYSFQITGVFNVEWVYWLVTFVTLMNGGLQEHLSLFLFRTCRLYRALFQSDMQTLSCFVRETLRLAKTSNYILFRPLTRKYITDMKTRWYCSTRSCAGLERWRVPSFFYLNMIPYNNNK